MKKGYKVIIAMLIICILLGMSIFLFDIWQENHMQKHIVEKYSFEISYPSHYQDNQKQEELDYTSRVKVSVSGEEIAEEMKSMNMSENVLNVKSDKSKMRLLVDAIYTPKATLDMEEICKRYAVMFRIYNEGLTIKEKRKQPYYNSWNASW